MNNGYPYLVAGHTYAKDKNGNDVLAGHMWLVDGYGTMTQYTEKLTHPTTKDSKQVTVILTNCLMVHCNMGNGTGNGWYIDGIFDVGNMALNMPNTTVASNKAPDLSINVYWIAPTPIR
jgi:hypothetical protein